MTSPVITNATRSWLPIAQGIISVCIQEQGWGIGESARLPPMWPGLNSDRVICGLSLLLVLVLAPGFFSVFSGFPPPYKHVHSKIQIDQDRGPAAKTDVAFSL